MGTYRVLCKLWSPRLTPSVGGPVSVCTPVRVRQHRSVGGSLVLWVLAVVLGPIFGTSCAGSITFPPEGLLLSPPEADH